MAVPRRRCRQRTEFRVRGGDGWSGQCVHRGSLEQPGRGSAALATANDELRDHADGSTSSDSPQSVTIQNIGNQPLNAITPGLIVGGQDYLQVAGPGTPADCTSSFALTPGASCNLSISFKPSGIALTWERLPFVVTGGGDVTGAATFTDNALNTIPSASQSIALQGKRPADADHSVRPQRPGASALYSTSFTVAATGGASGNPVTFTSSGACSNLGATYSMTSGTGTCSVIANQAGNSNYAAAPAVTVTVAAIPATQSIVFNQNAPATAAYNSNFTVTATGGASGNPVTFTSSGACSNSGAVYTMTSSAGTCSVIANQAGNDNYSAAPTVTQTVTANPASQTITFTQSAPANRALQRQLHGRGNRQFGSGSSVTFSKLWGLQQLGRDVYDDQPYRDLYGDSESVRQCQLSGCAYRRRKHSGR